MKLKIRKGDQVEVISGRLDDKGKRGKMRLPNLPF